MEDLTKQQIILLTLLLSFVTSIATGIITVSLLNEAPVEVRQTINRVVERTVETVVPDGLEPQEQVVTVKETVVVSEEYRVVDVVDRNKNNLVRIYKNTSENPLFSLGAIVSREGLILANKNIVFNKNSDYVAVLSDGSQRDLEIREELDSSNYLFFDIVKSEDENFGFSKLSRQDTKLGQTIVRLGGATENSVNVGRVVNLSEEDAVVNIDVSNQGLKTPGEILLNLSGEIISVYDMQSQSYVSAKKITDQTDLLTVGESLSDPNTASVINSQE